MPDTAMPAPFEAYVGDEPYLFASYAHTDDAIVFPEITYLRDQGYRVWFDEGIDPGNEWPDEVAKALAGAAFFLVFISPNAVASQNVRNEINYALNNKKPFLAIHVEETDLPGGLELRMGDIQAIMKYQMQNETYRRKLERTLPRLLQDPEVLEGRTRAKELLFSAQCPRAMSPGAWHPLYVYVYHDSAEDAVSEDISEATKQPIRDRPVQLASSNSESSGQPTHLVVSLAETPDIHLNPEKMTIGVYDSWHRFEFQVRPIAVPVDTHVETRIDVTLDCALAVPITDLQLAFDVVRDAHGAAPIITESTAYRKIFACYSSRDTAIVKRLEEVAAAMGDTLLRDAVELRPGKNWARASLQLIEEADIFQLFWSSNAKDSEFCRFEWEYALSLGRPNFIRPVYWEDPMPEPPVALQCIHFQRIDV